MMFVYATLIIPYLVVLWRRALAAPFRGRGEDGAVITTATEPSLPNQRSVSAVPSGLNSTFALEWPDQRVHLKSSLETSTMRLSPAGSRAGEGRWS